MRDAEKRGEQCILVVDDEPLVRDLCSKALRDYRVLQAGSGDEAIRCFEQGGVDVIITDVMMPNMNGLSLLKRLKQLEPTLVVIIMTGFAEKNVILDALREDADDFITKPINLLQLKTTVEKALVKKALKEEIASLRSLDRLKSNFLSLISHKFRTPITVISLFMQNLESAASAGKLDQKAASFREGVEMAFEETLYLERLVGDLLVFTQMMDAGGAICLEPCDLENMILRTVSRAQKSMRRESVETSLEVESLPAMRLDRDKCSFALRQVVENAFKFSGEAGLVSVKACRDGEEVRITVSDRGCGIPSDDLPKVFEKFYQVDPEHTGQVPGFGLGLFYAREFIKAHSGSIGIESVAGEGTTVTILLPVTS